MCEKYDKSEDEKASCHRPLHGCRKANSKRLARRCPDVTRVPTISYIDILPDEILEKIITETLLASDFSWPSHVCRSYNYLRNVSVRFCRITSGLAWTLPRIHLAERGEPGIVRVKTLLRKCGPGSGAILEVKRILASRDWKNASLKLRFCGLGWFMIENIFWNWTHASLYTLVNFNVLRFFRNKMFRINVKKKLQLLYVFGSYWGMIPVEVQECTFKRLLSFQTDGRITRP